MILGTLKVIPTPDVRISPRGRKHRKAQDDEEKPGGRNPGMGISVWLLGFVNEFPVSLGSNDLGAESLSTEAGRFRDVSSANVIAHYMNLNKQTQTIT